VDVVVDELGEGDGHGEASYTGGGMESRGGGWVFV
jgi:hypothetical protein